MYVCTYVRMYIHLYLMGTKVIHQFWMNQVMRGCTTYCALSMWKAQNNADTHTHRHTRKCKQSLLHALVLVKLRSGNPQLQVWLFGKITPTLQSNFPIYEPWSLDKWQGLTRSGILGYPNASTIIPVSCRSSHLEDLLLASGCIPFSSKPHGNPMAIPMKDS